MVVVTVTVVPEADAVMAVIVPAVPPKPAPAEPAAVIEAELDAPENDA
jgi:hypothetical protein